MADQYIWHVTLSTGDTRQSWLSEVGADILPMVNRILDKALLGSDPQIPGFDRCTLHVTRYKRCILATVFAADGAPLVTFGVAGDSHCGAEVWRALVHPYAAEYPNTVRWDRPPKEPWCAVRLEIGLVLHPETARMLGDFERCIAWAWLLRDQDGAAPKGTQ